jgi:glycosyltransferase involved in cell wall biosynthesis
MSKQRGINKSLGNKLGITIMFPFLNDWGTVGSLVALAVSTVKRFTDDWEVVIVNDGSSQNGREALEMIVGILSNSQHPISNKNNQIKKRIRIIHHEKNRGYGGALRSGFAAAKKDFIFYTDCDAQYDPRELALLIQKIHPNTGMVNGYKIKRNDPWIRIVAGRLYHHTVKLMFSLPIRDTDCDFRLIRREVFNPSPDARSGSGRTAVRLYENTGTICTELVKKVDHAGYRITEVPVHHFWRTSGKSQFFNFRRLYATGTNLLKLWWKLIILKNYSS